MFMTFAQDMDPTRVRRIILQSVITAVLTTSILLLNDYGIIPMGSAVLINIFIVGVFFRLAAPINRLLGKTGSKVISIIASLLLAAIAVMIVRKGIMAFIQATAG
jgi:multiple antibiotic resistance protein